MDGELHGPEGTQIVGYSTCHCGRLELATTFRTLGGRCLACYDLADPRNVRVVEVIHRGRRAELKIPGPRRRPNRGSKGSKATGQIRKHAERAALKRLRSVHPEEYQLFYEEERIRRGLPVVTPADREALTSDHGAFYAALTDAGVDLATLTDT